MKGVAEAAVVANGAGSEAAPSAASSAFLPKRRYSDELLSEGLVEVEGGADEGHVRKRLWEVPKRLAACS